MPEKPPEDLPLADGPGGEENAEEGSVSVGRRAFPQGLKPGSLGGADGGTEVPPLQDESEDFPEIAKENEPMIEVHAPHESVHSWKDAFIHIAIIVVGLLIAVGLDEAAEHFHHMRQVRETREALNKEYDYNIKLFQQTSRDIRWETAEYQNNLLVFEYLEKHPGTAQQKLPGVLAWIHGDNRYRYGAWETAQQSGMTALMPQEEVTQAATMYHDLHHAEEMAEEEYAASHEALAYGYQDDDPSHLTAAEVAKELELTRTVLMWHYRYELALRLIEQRDPGFTSGPTNADFLQMRNLPDKQTQELLAPARALTLERMKAAGYDPTTSFRSPNPPAPQGK